MKKRIIICSIIITIIGIGIGSFCLYKAGVLFPKPKSEPTVAIKECPSTNNGKEISFKGKNGKTVLEVLQTNCKVTTSGTGSNVFLTSVNGIASNDTEGIYWIYYVNDEMGMVGINSLITKDSDIITFKYEKSKF